MFYPVHGSDDSEASWADQVYGCPPPHGPDHPQCRAANTTGKSCATGSATWVVVTLLTWCHAIQAVRMIYSILFTLQWSLQVQGKWTVMRWSQAEPTSANCRKVGLCRLFNKAPGCCLYGDHCIFIHCCSVCHGWDHRWRNCPEDLMEEVASLRVRWTAIVYIFLCVGALISWIMYHSHEDWMRVRGWQGEEDLGKTSSPVYRFTHVWRSVISGRVAIATGCGGCLWQVKRASVAHDLKVHAWGSNDKL